MQELAGQIQSYLWNYGLNQQRSGDILQKETKRFNEFLDVKKKGKNYGFFYVVFVLFGGGFFFSMTLLLSKLGVERQKRFQISYNSRTKDKNYTEDGFPDSIYNLTG